VCHRGWSPGHRSSRFFRTRQPGVRHARSGLGASRRRGHRAGRDNGTRTAATASHLHPTLCNAPRSEDDRTTEPWTQEPPTPAFGVSFWCPLRVSSRYDAPVNAAFEVSPDDPQGLAEAIQRAAQGAIVHLVRDGQAVADIVPAASCVDPWQHRLQRVVGRRPCPWPDLLSAIPGHRRSPGFATRHRCAPR
jgi:antitoxin (DNA-binding transcriptional repressor) of toxin-antitoxin stability system